MSVFSELRKRYGLDADISVMYQSISVTEYRVEKDGLLMGVWEIPDVSTLSMEEQCENLEFYRVKVSVPE